MWYKTHAHSDHEIEDIGREEKGSLSRQSLPKKISVSSHIANSSVGSSGGEAASTDAPTPSCTLRIAATDIFRLNQ